MKYYFICGGGWASNLQYCYIISRSSLESLGSGNSIGFRLIKKLKQ